MPKRALNEAERYVIKQWAASCELERSMESARMKYQQMCERVMDDFVELHPDFHVQKVKVIHTASSRSGQMCVAKKGWPKDGSQACGFWFENIRLEYLSDEDEPPPLMSVWLPSVDDVLYEKWEEAKTRIAKEAEMKLPKDLLVRAKKSLDDDGYAVAYEFASKGELLEAIAHTDTERFPALLTHGLKQLLLLAPVIDEVTNGLE